MATPRTAAWSVGGRGLLALLIVSAAGCAAHLPGAGERVAFLERSTFSVASDRSQLYEVDPAAHLLLWNGLEEGPALDEGGFTTAGSISFLGAFRMVRADSAPIRTPTFEPRARLQLFRAAAPPPGAPPGASLLGALELSIGHRSNGQSGCALADHVRVGRGDFDCAPIGELESTRLNVADGSFTTNYVSAGLAGLWSPPRPSLRPAPVLWGGTTIEWNVPCDFGACMPPEMRARHGAAVLRGHLDAELPALLRASLAGVRAGLGLRATLAGSVHLGVTAGAPFGDASAELAVVLRPRKGMATSLFVRRHQGRDPLNIRFEERLDAWIIGLAFEPDVVTVALGGRGGRGPE